MRSTIVIISLLLTCIAHGQEMEIVNATERTFHGTISEDIVAPIRIKNISQKPIYVFVKRINQNIGSTQSTNFCWGSECFDKGTDKLPISKRIEPGQEVNSFVSILQSGLVGGFSTVKYEIYTRGNPNEVIQHEITYIIDDKVSNNILYESDNLKLNEVYPNPVKEYAFFDYQMSDPETEAKILIHNVLGSVVGEFILNPLEKELKISTVEYNPGVYFYTLYIDGDGVITKKLVIRR